MKRKEIISEYLSFNRRERIAVLVLSVLIVIIFFIPDLLPKNTQTTGPVDTAWMSEVRKLEGKVGSEGRQETGDERQEENNGYYRYDPEKLNYTRKKGELFYFDPNTISASEWSRLGLREKTIRTIQNFLSKGGKFRKPGDLQKIYGLFPDEYERIAPYIRIASANSPADGYKPNTAEIKTARTYPARYTVVEINSADTSALIALPGIGSKLASRIVSFREKLGGFYSVDQVGETFGLADSTFQKIKQYLKIEGTSVRKININTATVDELKAHPYIRYTLANPIVAYRNEHGPFQKVEDVKKVMAVTEELYNKIGPYFSL